ncbi:hypothetical protein BAE44_0020397 [Dichanthelium oligosanthes]|uniref:Uncharacterized protein n=1 Tax=Dichanthelium oligosanthes TaxID=888268 RepID=A0A1E5V0L0_9POAL|nr:hypothetical protein BAE44_0020397 [Dichanthelium oligosanthes]
MQETLKRLDIVLNDAYDLVQSCQRKKKAFDFLRAYKKTGEFNFLNEQITYLMESITVANRTLLMGLYSDQTFMVVLRILLRDDACRRVLQSAGGEMHQRILKCWDAAEAARYEDEIQQVENIANDIVLKAKDASHNKEEVQRVAQLARHVLCFLPNLRLPLMIRHPDTRELVTKLRQDLEAARKTVGGAATVTGNSSFWRDHAKQTSGHGNSIEHDLQSLTFIALNELMNNTS